MPETEESLSEQQQVSENIVINSLNEQRRKKRIVKRIIAIVLIAVFVFMVINFRMIFAGFTNAFRFVTFSASRYNRMCDRIKQGIETRETEIELDDKTGSVMLQRLAHEFSGGRPEIFYINIRYSDYNRKYVLYIEYKYSDEQIKAMTAEFNAMIDEIVCLVDKKASKPEKIKFFHDYLIRNITYDSSDKTTCYDAYHMLKQKRGVCQAYALTMKALLNRCDIECEVVWSTVYNHAWNVVKIGGIWYQLDVTWDDTGDEPSYKYFLVTDNALTDRGHGQWANCGAYVHSAYSPVYMIKYASLRNK